MDRTIFVRSALLICLGLASGCESRGTSGRGARQSAEQEPGRLPSSVLAAGFHAQEPTSGGSTLSPEMVFGSPSTSQVEPNQAWLGAGQLGLPEAAPAEQPIGPSLTDETCGESTLAAEDSEEIVRLPAGPPVETISTDLEPAAEYAVPESAPPVEALAVQLPPVQQPVQIPIAEESAPPAAVPQDVPHERLPWADAKMRSSEMEAISQSADALVRQGFRLAERGAVYSARLKFFAALTLIARSLDVEQHTQVYTNSLVAGRVALTEAWDFRAEGLPKATDMKRIVAAHRTPVLAQVAIESLSPVAAQQRYFSYAQEQLAVAAGKEPVGSLALYGLGKSAPALHGQAAAPNLTVAGEQMACYQAAILVDDQNFRAMNELGVLLAAHGRWEGARDLFMQTLAISENAATLRNLSAVWSHLGDSQRALQAAQRADKLSSTRLGAITGSNLRWVDPETFARSLPPSEGLAPPVVSSNPSQQPATAAPPAKKRTAMWPWKQEITR
jgi:tetratricopeptide (TPR) repeat protein